MTTLHSLNMMNEALAGGFGPTSTRGTGRARGFFARIGAWFRWTDGADDTQGAVDVWSGDVPVVDAGVTDTFSITSPGTGAGRPGRRRLLRGWKRRPSSRRRLAEGVSALGDVMRDVRDQLEQQSARQEEMLPCLLQLPQVLGHLHETQQAQVEVLRAMGQRVERQTARQDQIAALLERIARTDADRGRTLEAVLAGVEGIGRHDETIASAVDAIGRGSDAGARAVEQLREDLAAREGQWERVLQRHNARFTGLLAIATTVAVAALTAVAVTGYLILARMHP